MDAVARDAMRNFYRWLFRLGAAKTALDERNDADAKRNGGADALREKDGDPVSESLDALLDELETLGVRMRRSSDDEVEFRFAFGASHDANEIAEKNVAAHDEMPAAAKPRSATAMDALGIVRDCLSMDAKKKGLVFDPAIHGKKEHAAITRAQKECEASFEECLARNKMACPYHGCQYMKAALLDELRRVKAKTADVEVVAAPSRGTFIATVRCVATKTEKVAVAQAVSAFLKRAEIVPNKDWMPTEKDYTRKDGGFVTPFDLREEDVESLDPEGDGDGEKEKDKGKEPEDKDKEDKTEKPIAKKKPEAKKEKEEKDDKKEEKPKDGELSEDEKAEIRDRIANYRLALEGFKHKNEEIKKRVKSAKEDLKTSSPDNWSKLQSMWMLSDEYRALRAVTDVLDTDMSKIQRWLDDNGKSESSWSEKTSASLNVIKQRIEFVIEDFANVEAKEKAAFAKLESFKKGGDGTEPTKEKKPLGETAERRKTLTEAILSKFTKLSKKKRSEMNAYHAHTFDDCPMLVLEAIEKSVEDICFQKRKKAWCSSDRTVFLYQKPRTWANNPFTLVHECAHAVLCKTGKVTFGSKGYRLGRYYYDGKPDKISDDCKELIAAAKREAAVWASSAFGEGWEKTCRRGTKNWYLEIGRKVFYVNEWNDAPDPQKAETLAAAISDIICATTNGKCFEGHKYGYYHDRPANQVHEIVAQITALMCAQETHELARKMFPETVRRVGMTAYGILDWK